MTIPTNNTPAPDKMPSLPESGQQSRPSPKPKEDGNMFVPSYIIKYESDNDANNSSPGIITDTRKRISIINTLDYEKASVKEYLENQSVIMRLLQPRDRPYVWLEEFVFHNGRQYYAIDRQKKYRRWKGAMQHCYYNAFSLASEHPELRYVEGYVKANKIIPSLHAWAVTPDGSVVDITWDDGTEYYGVEFNMDYVRRVRKQKREYGVIDNWKNKFALLCGTETGWEYK